VARSSRSSTTPAIERLPLAAALAASLALAAPFAQATPAQGYSFTLTPVAHASTHWVLVHAVERSDPNTATATVVLPSMAKERVWWLVFDGRGRQRCSVAAAAADPALDALRSAGTVDARTPLLARVRKGCASVTAGTATWLAAEPAPALRWSSKQVCAGERCVAATTPQRSLHGVRSQAAEGAVPAAARCVASRWLIVDNAEADDGSGRIEGARFRGLPPAVRSDIVGYETVAIDGIVTLPPSLSCP
jgi:hypothetical protein